MSHTKQSKPFETTKSTMLGALGFVGVGFVIAMIVGLIFSSAIAHLVLESLGISGSALGIAFWLQRDRAVLSLMRRTHAKVFAGYILIAAVPYAFVTLSSQKTSEAMGVVLLFDFFVAYALYRVVFSLQQTPIDEAHKLDDKSVASPEPLPKSHGEISPLPDLHSRQQPHLRPSTTVSINDAELFGLVAKELAINQKDEGLWTMAFALESGDEAKTKAHYIRLRVAKLRQEAVARPVAQMAPQQPARLTEDGVVSSRPVNSKIPDVRSHPAKNESHLMQQAQQEFDSGQHDPEILAKAKSFAAGDATKIRDLYVRFRANALIDASSELQRSVEADRRRNIARAAKEVEAQQLAEKQRLDAISASPERIQLMSMVRRNQVELVRQLISVNPELVLAYDSEGRTALHLAVDEGAINLIKVLLEFGANPSARDVAGRTPAELATRKSPTLAAMFSRSPV